MTALNESICVWGGVGHTLMAFFFFCLCWVFIVVRGLLIAVASPVVEHGL